MFTAELRNATPLSLFLSSSEPFAFREKLKLFIGADAVESEVAYVAQTPPLGAVVVFTEPPENEKLLKRLMRSVSPLSEDLAAELEVKALPEDEGVPATRDDLVALISPDLLQAALVDDSQTALPQVSLPKAPPPKPSKKRAVIDRSSGRPLPSPPPQVLAEDLSQPAVHVPPARRPRPRAPTQAPPPATAFPSPGIGLPAVDEPRSARPRSMSSASGQSKLPVLSNDDRLSFASHEDFKTQFRTDITHGGLLVRSPPLPIGSQRRLSLVVPGAPGALELSVRVGFVGKGTVGFMIDSFAAHRPKLKALLDQLPD